MKTRSNRGFSRGRQLSPKQEDIVQAVEFIKQNEWAMHLKAYRDFKQYSICHWVKSYKWETVTANKCDKRLYDSVKARWDIVNTWTNLTDNQKVALTSLFYNIWVKKDILRYAKKWDHKSVVYLMSKYKYAWWKIAGWLVKRRKAEVLMYNKIDKL